jgi:adenylate cyclase
MTSAENSDYLADAVTEDIVTALSRQHLFFVIASSSSFTYKGRDIELSRVGQELGVRYLLQGSIRKVGDRVRVTAQLVDVAERSNIWADRYDRELVDLLALQDEVTERVVAAIEPAILHREGARAVRKSLADFNALDCFYRGMWHLNRVSREGYDEALALFSEAVLRDPELALGHIGLARILFGGAIFGWSPQPVEDLKRALECARTAIRLDPRDAYAYFASSGASLYLGDHGAALADARTAVDLNDNCAPAQVRMGQTLIFGGRPAEAIAPLERGMRLSPYDSQLGVMLDSIALAHYLVGEYEAAMVRARAAMHQTGAAGSIVLAASLAQLGRLGEAQSALPSKRWEGGSPQRPMSAPYANPAHLEHLRAGIRAARHGAGDP